jgi:hypothetical protein
MLLLIAVSTAGCATDRMARNDCDWAQPMQSLHSMGSHPRTGVEAANAPTLPTIYLMGLMETS